MVKINLMFVCALALATLFSMGANAQTKVWGVGASVGVADGAFQNPFVSTGTAGSYSQTSWTALSINDNSGLVPGAAYWTRSLFGYSQGAYAAPPGQTPPPMPSPSQTNGVAIFDSGFLDNGGSTVAGTGTSPSTHRGELISPEINLTGYIDTPLVVQFFSQYRDFQINELSVSLSTDDGVTWGTPFDYRVLQGNSSPGWVRVLMPTVTQGVANLSQCRLRFVFDNDYYYAMVDDITIETAPPYDIAMGNPDPSSTLLVGSGDFVKIGGNRYQAECNLDPTNLKEWFWGGKVVNYGAQTLYPQDSARIHVNIDYYDDINPPVFGVYTDTMYIDTLLAGDATGVTMIDYLRDINFLLSNRQGRYQVSYWVAHNQVMDGTATNDTVRHTFNITGTPTSYISKARRALSDGRVFSSRAMFPSGTEFSSFEYGSVYYFPLGATNNLNIDSVEFRYQVPNGYTGAVSQTLFINVYRVYDGTGAAAPNGTIDGDEVTQVGVAPITVTGLGTTTPAGSYAFATAINFVDPVSGGPMAGLADHGTYYISLMQEPSLTGGPPTFNATSGLWHGADNYNYYMNAAMTRPDTIINPSPIRIIDATGISTWYWTGFGADVVPSLGVHLNPCVLYSNIVPLLKDATEMSVFPNPAGNYLNVNVQYDQPTDVRYILTDVSGRVLKIFSSSQITEETQAINLDNLSSGVYFITAKSDKGITTKQFIKK